MVQIANKMGFLKKKKSYSREQFNSNNNATMTWAREEFIVPFQEFLLCASCEES
jgi:hypothetical protein